MKPMLAIILARAGSKGVPGKNAAMVGGRPCVAWTIDDARGARAVDRVVVSTDCAAVAACARAMGVEVVERPAFLASDTATVDDAARDCVRRLCGGDEDGTIDTLRGVALLYANAPVRPSGLLDRAIGLFDASGCDSVQSYAPVGKHHPWWTAVVEDGGAVRAWEGDVLNHGVYRRQDLPAAHVPDGGVLVVSSRALFQRIEGVAPGPHAFFGKDRRGVLTREGDVVDIDSKVDLLVADAILRERAETARRTA